MAFSLLPTDTELTNIQSIEDARTWAGLAEAPWNSVSISLGTVPSLRVLAMVPVTTLQGALQAARVPDGVGGQRELSAVE